jgi:plastocyanin
VRRDSDAADALFRADQRPVSKVDAEGTRVWRVLLGDSTPNDHVAILAFMPAETNIAAGERVRFAYRDRIDNEVHTVTFPTELSGSPGPPPYGLGGLGFLPACDFDDPSTGMKGVPGLWGVMGPDCPANLELVLQPWMTEAHPAPGNQVLTRATYHDSAMLLPPRAPKNFRTLPDSGKLLPPAFEAEFPAPGTFTFECDVHVDLMTGSINAS